MPRLHKSSWVVAALTLVVCVLIVVPGQIVDPDPFAEPTYFHGWPAEFLLREARSSNANSQPNFITHLDLELAFAQMPQQRASWLTAEGWKLWRATKTEWKLLNLALDIAAALAIIGAMTAIWEYRRRRRGNVFQLRLSDFFVVTAVVALVLYWLQSHAQEYASEIENLAALHSVDTTWPSDDRFESVGPIWLQRLVGPGYLPACFNRVHKIGIWNDLNVKDIDQLVLRLKELEHLNTIYVGDFGGWGRPPDSEWKAQLRKAIDKHLPHVEFR